MIIMAQFVYILWQLTFPSLMAEVCQRIMAYASSSLTPCSGTMIVLYLATPYRYSVFINILVVPRVAN